MSRMATNKRAMNSPHKPVVDDVTMIKIIRNVDLTSSRPKVVPLIDLTIPESKVFCKASVASGQYVCPVSRKDVKRNKKATQMLVASSTASIFKILRQKQLEETERKKRINRIRKIMLQCGFMATLQKRISEQKRAIKGLYNSDPNTCSEDERRRTHQTSFCNLSGSKLASQGHPV